MDIIQGGNCGFQSGTGEVASCGMTAPGNGLATGFIGADGLPPIFPGDGANRSAGVDAENTDGVGRGGEEEWGFSNR